MPATHSSIDRARVAAMIRKGLDNDQIAERLGAQPKSISKIRNELAREGSKREGKS